MMKEEKYDSQNEKRKGNNEKPKLTDEEKQKEEEKIWGDLIDGEEVNWSDMSETDKFLRIMLNTAKIFCVFGFLYFFVCSLDLLSSSFRLISGKTTGTVMNNEYISNPVVGLMIGILVTVLVQSSSTSTSIIVSMVAANILKVHEAIPMILGSNIGTSVTNTIVSLTQVGNRDQFGRAFAGATVHDMFNWLAVTIILIIEVLTGMLEKLTTSIVKSFSNGQGMDVKTLTVLTEPFTHLIIQLDKNIVKCWGMGFKMDETTMMKKFCDFFPMSNISYDSFVDTTEIPANSTLKSILLNSTILLPERCRPKPIIGIPNSCQFIFYETSLSDSTVGIILLILSLTILCSSLVCIVKILNSLLKGSIAVVIKKVINADIPYVPWLTGYIAIFVGAILTFIVQSSSVFTSTLTPLIGMGIITVDRAYPLTLGSNIGTTTTALLAAMAAEGDKTDSIQIALVHFFFNIIGIAMFYPIPFMRWPIPLCKALGDITAKYRWFAIFYLIAMFFFLPGSIFALSLGGPALLWGVLGPIVGILVFVILVNVLQSKKPGVLPEILLNWNFLPEPMRSLAPYDRVFLGLSCCTKCKSTIEEHEIQEVVTDPIVTKKPIGELKGVDNPITVSDECFSSPKSAELNSYMGSKL